MNHASSVPVDSDAHRYLKHHAVLEGARARAYVYLNQIWLQLNRLLTRELGGELRRDNWIEVISIDEDQMCGLRWRSTSLEGGVILEIADVRRWTHVSGDHIVFTVSSAHSQTRKLLTERCRDQWVESAFKAIYPSVSLLKYGPESSRVISIATPLKLSEPRSEAQSVIEGIVSLWELIEGGGAASDSQWPRGSEPGYENRPRYASAAPPISPSPTEASFTDNTLADPRRREVHSMPPFPPTITPMAAPPPSDLDLESASITPHSEDLSDTQREVAGLSGMSKEEMIQAIQAQVRQRPGRLIRGGDRKSTPVLSEPPRFVPRSLAHHEEREANAVHRNEHNGDDAEGSGRIHDPHSAEGVEPVNLISEVETTPPHSPQLSAVEEINEPSYIKPVHLDERSVDPHAVIIKGSEGTPEAQALFNSPESAGGAVDLGAGGVAPLPSGEELTHFEEENETAGPIEASELDAKMLSGALSRIGLTPWRVNAYDEGRGQILWLSNGAHIDYNPAGDAILGGENQDETRARLSQMGILI